MVRVAHRARARGALRGLAGLALAASISLCGSSEVRADVTRAAPAYRLHLDLDLSLVLVGGAVTSGFLVLDEASGVACATACDRSRINFLDRPAAGLYSEEWNSVGNIAVAGTLAFPVLSLVLFEGVSAGLNDTVVVGEAAILASALQVLTSYAVGRPRPRVYGDEAPLADRTDGNAARSFFSGHVADTVAVTVGAMRTFQRLGRPELGWIVLAAGGASSTFIAVSRVLAGSHFPTDTLAGAAVGIGLGLALPALHDSAVRLVPTAVPGGSVLSLVGQLP
jgi:membrane-associated phospholipid phosphatase